MMFKIKIFITIFFCLICFGLSAQEAAVSPSEESDQQINDFSLAGYGDKGKKAWELAGKSADIFTEVVKLKDVTGNMYGEEENIKLTSKKGDFDKSQGKIHLQDDVVITTTSGAKLTTDSLDWDRKNQLVSTKDIVNIERDNMLTVARGAAGQPDLKKVDLEKDVKVEIHPDKQTNKGENVIITCDGPLSVDYEKNVAVFNNNVKVDRSDSQIYCDKMDIYFLKAGKKVDSQDKESEEGKKTPAFLGSTQIDKIIARGNVKIVRGENVSYSDEATYSAVEKKIILSGKPKLILYSSEDFANASLGN